MREKEGGSDQERENEEGGGHVGRPMGASSAEMQTPLILKRLGW